jgi:4-hydroxy-tetrahydrodipicolinate synthase
VIGVKWASPTPLQLVEAMDRVSDRDLAWVGGLAETWAPPLYVVGARGFTSGLINVFPELSVKIHQALEQGAYPAAMALIRSMADFEALRAQERNGSNVSVVKAALQLIGHDCGAARPPATWPLSQSDLKRLEGMLKTWGKLA